MITLLTRLRWFETTFRNRRAMVALGVLITFVQIVQRISGIGPKTLLREELKPGEALIVTNARR